MDRLTAIAAVFAALIAVASATTYTTVVTTTTEDKNPQQSCQREIQQMRMARCMQWMKIRRGPHEDSFLRSVVANTSYEEEFLEECCNTLRSMSSPCRCETIRTMISRIQEQHQVEEEALPMLRQKAQTLPCMCNWRSPTEC